jgi:lipopolysaccharide/colanic/teichoic acid biosynthesis glycosyltransferase
VRFYLSTRPGLFGIRAIENAAHEDAAHYKGYIMSWSLLADAVILWQELSVLWRKDAE